MSETLCPKCGNAVQAKEQLERELAAMTARAEKAEAAWKQRTTDKEAECAALQAEVERLTALHHERRAANVDEVDRLKAERNHAMHDYETAVDALHKLSAKADTAIEVSDIRRQRITTLEILNNQLTKERDDYAERWQSIAITQPSITERKNEISQIKTR